MWLVYNVGKDKRAINLAHAKLIEVRTYRDQESLAITVESMAEESDMSIAPFKDANVVLAKIMKAVKAGVLMLDLTAKTK